MEDALRDEPLQATVSRDEVLILIVMEDALRDTKYDK